MNGQTLEMVPQTASTVIDRGGALATSEVIERTKRIREVMEKVMKSGVHYGTIPGTPKPTMYQPGADVLAVTFRIAPQIARIEDLSQEDEIRYRITVRGVHQGSSELLAEGVGECSSNEEKYRWRRPVCEEEWKEAPEDRRREKWQKGQNSKAYKNKQIRTSPSDVANTVLKMAVKRAKVAMILNATAASDVFAQDLEDLSEELRDSLSEEQGEQGAAVPMPQRKTEAPTPAAHASGSAPAPPADTAAAGVRVTLVEKKESQKHQGQFWYLVHTSDGKQAATWDEALATRCAELGKAHTVVTLASEAGQPYAKLLEVAVAGGAS